MRTQPNFFVFLKRGLSFTSKDTLPSESSRENTSKVKPTVHMFPVNVAPSFIAVKNSNNFSSNKKTNS